MSRPIGAALVLLLALGACGVPSDDSPREISPARVPFGLLEPDRPPSTRAEGLVRKTDVFLVTDDRLTTVARDVPEPITPGKVVRILLDGPTNAEAAMNLRSAIATTSGVSATTPANGLVSVELGRSFATSGPSNQVLGVAQLVYTVTALPGVDRVSFTLNGRPAEVPLGDGTLTTRPVGRADFQAVAPR